MEFDEYFVIAGVHSGARRQRAKTPALAAGPDLKITFKFLDMFFHGHLQVRVDCVKTNTNLKIALSFVDASLLYREKETNTT